MDLLHRGKTAGAALAEVIARVRRRRRRPGRPSCSPTAAPSPPPPGAPACAGVGCPAGWSSPPSPTTTTRRGSTSPTGIPAGPPTPTASPSNPSSIQTQTESPDDLRLRLPPTTCPPTSATAACATTCWPGSPRPQVAAAQVVLRQGRQRAVRGHHPAAGVLPDPDGAGDPDRRTPPTIVEPAGTRHADRARVGVVGEDPAAAGRDAPSRRALQRTGPERARVRRPGRQRGRAAAGLRRPGRAATRGCGSRRCAPTSPINSICCRPGADRTVAFLGGTIGNFDPAERAAFLRALRAGCGPDDHFLLGADLVKSGRRPGPRLRRRRRGDRGVQPQSCSMCSTIGLAPISTAPRSTTSRSGTPTTSGSRCGCGRPAPGAVRIPTLDLDVRLRARRGHPHGDLREVPPGPADRRTGRRRIRQPRLVDRPPETGSHCRCGVQPEADRSLTPITLRDSKTARSDPHRVGAGHLRMRWVIRIPQKARTKSAIRSSAAAATGIRPLH